MIALRSDERERFSGRFPRMSGAGNVKMRSSREDRVPIDRPIGDEHLFIRPAYHPLFLLFRRAAHHDATVQVCSSLLKTPTCRNHLASGRHHIIEDNNGQIEFLDHLVIGSPQPDRPGYFSFKEAGILA